MKKEFDLKLIEESIKNILIALGEDPNREGLKETPQRVAKMYEEVFEGIKYTNDELAEMFSKTFEDTSSNMVIEKDIPTFSYCEHHMALMYNMKVSIAYIPNKRVIGLSKIIRIVDMASRRLQLQERLTKDISEILCKACNTKSVAIVIEGEHSCMTARGIKKSGSKTITSYFTGEFETDINKKREFLDTINR